MAFGPRAIFGGIALDPAPDGAPTVNSFTNNPPNNWSVGCTQISLSDSKGIRCVIVPKPDPATDPLDGLDAVVAAGLPGAIVQDKEAGPDQTVNFAGEWTDSYPDQTPVSGGCYSTDRLSDLTELEG